MEGSVGLYGVAVCFLEPMLGKKTLRRSERSFPFSPEPTGTNQPIVAFSQKNILQSHVRYKFREAIYMIPTFQGSTNLNPNTIRSIPPSLLLHFFRILLCIFCLQSFNFKLSFFLFPFVSYSSSSYLALGSSRGLPVSAGIEINTMCLALLLYER